MRWLLLLLMIVGCGGRAVVSVDGPSPVRYVFSVSGDFGAISDASTGSNLQDATEAELVLRLSVVPVRRFIDGSLGQRVRVDHATLSVDGQPYDELELEGRTVELRTFPDGEILTLGWVDRWAGPHRFMEVFEVVFPAISPAPPSLKRGQTSSRRIIWPFLGDDRLRWDSAVDARWTNHGPVEHMNSKAWHLAYEGPWRVHGGRRTGAGAFKASASGDASGSVYFDQGSGDMVTHQFSWSREVSLSGPGGRLTQAQAFSGKVERLP